MWRALEELQAEGAPDFSISRVGSRSEKLGGPKTQSLRNEGGEDYRELISAFARDIGREMRPSALRPASQLDEAIGRIPDLAVRTLIRLKLEDAKRLKTENDTLRMAFRELSVDASGIKVDSDRDKVEAAYEVQEGICLVGSEVAAIQPQYKGSSTKTGLPNGDGLRKLTGRSASQIDGTVSLLPPALCRRSGGLLPEGHA